MNLFVWGDDVVVCGNMEVLSFFGSWCVGGVIRS